jgi:hypothetical protein
MNKAEGTPTISPHEITPIEQISEGQFGTVWRGECRGMEVAIKYLKDFDHSMKEVSSLHCTHSS